MTDPILELSILEAMLVGVVGAIIGIVLVEWLDGS